MDLTAFVLAGGQSTRMGTDKAFLQLNGRTLLMWVLDLARSVTPNVRIVGARAKFAQFADTVEDIFPGCGPLGGIHAALTATRTDLNLILAVDAPFVRPEFLLYLVAQAEQSRALVTVPRVERMRSASGEQGSGSAGKRPRQSGRRSDFHPLCAVYRRAFRDVAEAALRAGHNKIDPLLTTADTCIISEAELERLSFPVSMFDNLNTREEFERVRTRS